MSTYNQIQKYVKEKYNGMSQIKVVRFLSKKEWREKSLKKA